jgi:hypothetical protein
MGSGDQRQDLPVRRPSASARWLALAVICVLTFSGSVAWTRLAPGDVEISLPVYRPTNVVQNIEERWHYRFTWSAIPVGEVTMSAKTAVADDAGRVLEVGLRGRTNRFIDLLWRYRLDAEGTIRLDPFSPDEFDSEESEQGKHKVTKIHFDRDKMVHTYRRKGDRVTEYEFSAPNTHDMLSAVFLFLNLDYHSGEVFRVDALTGTARYLVTVRVMGREEIKVGGRNTPAYRLWVTTSELTDPDEDDANHRGTSIWVSDDRPRRLLKARSRTFVGAVTLELQSVEKISPTPAEVPAAAADDDQDRTSG